MAISVKILSTLLLIAMLGTLTANERFSAPKVISADGADIVFRELLIKKSMNETDFKCIVTQDSLENSLPKLKSGQCDMILVKKTPQELKSGKIFDCITFAATPILVFVNKNNKISKMKLHSLQQIFNGDINQWSFFNKSNIFSIHRFAMPYDDSSFAFVKRALSLRDNTQHFPLSSADQIIKMVASNPNAIGICVFEKNLNYENINLIQLTDENGKNISLKMPHTIIFRPEDKNKVIKFLKVSE